MSDKMKKLALGIELKQKEICLLALNEYPVGTIVDVEIHGHQAVRIEIKGHNDNWWSGAGEIYGVNIFTGKDRKFNPINDATTIATGPA